MPWYQWLLVCDEFGYTAFHRGVLLTKGKSATEEPLLTLFFKSSSIAEPNLGTKWTNINLIFKLQQLSDEQSDDMQFATLYHCHESPVHRSLFFAKVWVAQTTSKNRFETADWLYWKEREI